MQDGGVTSYNGAHSILGEILEDYPNPRPVGWGGSVGSDEPPTEAIEFHLAWMKQGSKVCKDNKPYAAICFKGDL